jgi:hypothetical protein
MQEQAIVRNRVHARAKNQARVQVQEARPVQKETEKRMCLPSTELKEAQIQGQEPAQRRMVVEEQEGLREPEGMHVQAAR